MSQVESGNGVGASAPAGKIPASSSAVLVFFVALSDMIIKYMTGAAGLIFVTCQSLQQLESSCYTLQMAESGFTMNLSLNCFGVGWKCGFYQGHK